MPNDTPDWTSSFSLLPGELTVQDLVVTGIAGAATRVRYVGGVSGAAPSSGTFLQGDLVIDTTGGAWVCTVGGTPGTWIWVGSRMPVPLVPVGGPLTIGGSVNVQGDTTLFTGGGQRTSEVDNDSSGQFATAQLLLHHTAGALPNAGHEEWAFQSYRTAAAGVASNTELTIRRFNAAQSIVQEYLRVNQTGDVHIADSGLFATGSPSPGLGDVSVGRLGVTGLPGAQNASRYVGATTGGAPSSGTFAVGDWIVDRTNAVIYECITAGTPGTWRRTDGVFGVGGSYAGSPTDNTRILTQFETKVILTSASGQVNISFPHTFPNNVITILVSCGDSNVNESMIQIIATTVSTTGFSAIVLNNSGVAINTQNIRINWLAIGF